MPGPYDLWCSGKDCSARFTEVADLVHHRKVAHPEELQTEYERSSLHLAGLVSKGGDLTHETHLTVSIAHSDRAFRTAADAALHFDSHGPIQCPRW